MIGGILQVTDLIINQRFTIFAIFFVSCWSIFAYRNYYIHKNKKYDNTPIITTTSAIILSYKDKPSLLKRCLDSIVAQKLGFTEVILGMDEKDNKENLSIAKYYTNKYGWKLVLDKGANKRLSIYNSIKQSSGKIIYILAGDTIYPDNATIETLKPFINPKVGATTMKQEVVDSHLNFAKRFANILFGLRYRLIYPSMSSKGLVICTTGEIGAFRRELIEKHLEEFIKESFYGKRCVLGDDRFITCAVLREGYDVVMQPTETIVYADAPDTFKNFIKQQLRWYRSNIRYTYMTLFKNWIPNKPKMLKVHCFNFLIMPYLFIAAVCYAIISFLIAPTPFIGTTNLTIFIMVFSFFLASFIKSSPHFLHKRKDLILFPLFAITATTVLLPLFVYATFTVKNQGSWLTK